MDYQAIIDNLRIESLIELMQKLGADRCVDKGGYLIFPTICHNIDSETASMKLYFYKNSKMFQCYSEDGSMSVFKFLKTYYETRDIEYDWYRDVYQVILDCSNYHKENFEIKKYKSEREQYENINKDIILPEYDKNVLDVFIKTYPQEWLDDHISREAMDKFNIRYSVSQNKIIIPHYDANGRLIGIRGRALNDWEIENLGKYMPVQVEDKWYKHPLSMNLYGLYENKENIRKSGVCYLYEAEKSVLQHESFSIPNCAVAVCGSQFNKYQLHILLRECSPQEIIICFDNEEKEGSKDYFEKLSSICHKYNTYTNFSFVYDRDHLTGSKDSPSDCGEETFKKLLRKRVKIYAT